MKAVVRLSCGSCEFFKNVGFKNWGECECPAPQWALEPECELSSVVWRDGGIQDLAEKCKTYKPNTSHHAEATADSVHGVVGGKDV